MFQKNIVPLHPIFRRIFYREAIKLIEDRGKINDILTKKRLCTLVSSDWNLGNFKRRIGNRINRCSRVYLYTFCMLRAFMPFGMLLVAYLYGVGFCICLFILQVFLGPQLLISKFQQTRAFLCRVRNTLTQKIYANYICSCKHSLMACLR